MDSCWLVPSRSTSACSAGSRVGVVATNRLKNSASLRGTRIHSIAQGVYYTAWQAMRDQCAGTACGARGVHEGGGGGHRTWMRRAEARRHLRWIELPARPRTWNLCTRQVFTGPQAPAEPSAGRGGTGHVPGAMSPAPERSGSIVWPPRRVPCQRRRSPPTLSAAGFMVTYFYFYK